jgi:hypothetical protein
MTIDERLEFLMRSTESLHASVSELHAVAQEQTRRAQEQTKQLEEHTTQLRIDAEKFVAWRELRKLTSNVSATRKMGQLMSSSCVA